MKRCLPMGRNARAAALAGLTAISVTVGELPWFLRRVWGVGRRACCTGALALVGLAYVHQQGNSPGIRVVCGVRAVLLTC